jgi:actin-like ATPase involved in cell morphogenesis
VIPHGGDAVDAVLKRLLLEKYPDLVLTDLTITLMKEELGSVSPVRKTAQVKVELGSTHRTIDVTDIVREACETQVPAVVGALQEVLGECPSDQADAFQEKIFLTGGGACLPGLPERVQSELERKGFHRAVVHSVARPRMVLALGALKWALVTPDGSWEVPLFAFRPTG